MTLQQVAFLSFTIHVELRWPYQKNSSISKKIDINICNSYSVKLIWHQEKPRTNPVFMKKRISTVLNFVAFNLLFFALYLNFIHKDNGNEIPMHDSSTASVKGTVLVSDPTIYTKADARVIKQETLQN